MIQFVHDHSFLQRELPDPFPIPHFRDHTQKKLENKQFDSDDRKYMVRVLATMLLAHVSRPTMKECEHVARALVQKYPFLDEYVSIKLLLVLTGLNLHAAYSSLGSSSFTPDAKIVTESLQGMLSLILRLPSDQKVLWILIIMLTLP